MMSVIKYYKQPVKEILAGGIRLQHLGQPCRAYLVPSHPVKVTHHVMFIKERLMELYLRNKSWFSTYRSFDNALENLKFRFERKYGKSELTGWRVNQLSDDDIVDLLNEAI